ncbi:MAG TPA: efflux transporter outer membrane subunit, partial [Rhizobacter sp.]|nr:efflux transporter outer membrane subunit [Rhizobacter sp.]
MPFARLRQLPCLLAVCFSGFLSACANLPPPPTLAAAAPAQWQAPLPHNGQLSDLNRWWQQFNDPLLSQLIGSAQDVSPSLASARARIEESRATRAQAVGALLPNLNASASAQRGRQDPSLPLASTSSVGLQASWEIDLFGGNRAARDAAQARLDGAQANWHGARVSVAAEVASTYLALRACEAQVLQTQADTGSRAETARLTELSAKAGFQSPANAALSRASAAQGKLLLTNQRAQCDLQVKALVALTGQDEAALRTQLASAQATLPQPADIGVQSVPAAVLNQRPDLYTAALDVVAASGDVTQAQALRYPRLTLAGSIATTRVESSLFTGNLTTWSVGPVQLTLPLFDGGVRAANVQAARARYDEASVVYRGKVRSAVREVEEALVQLQSTSARNDDARVAVEGFENSLRATEALYQGGLSSLFDLEAARRSAVLAQSALIDLQRERVAAWISLYRALGGG